MNAHIRTSHTGAELPAGRTPILQETAKKAKPLSPRYEGS